MVANKRKRKIVVKSTTDSDQPSDLPRFSRAGRALRKPSSGVDSSFVDSTTAIDDVSSDEVSELSSHEEGIVVKARRRLSPTPELKEFYFEPAGIDQRDNDSLPSEDEAPLAKRHGPIAPLANNRRPYQLVFNVPEGPARQVVLNMSSATSSRGSASIPNSTYSAMRASALAVRSSMRQDMAKRLNASKNISENVIYNAGLVGRLPTELRDQIYGNIFYSTEAINLGEPSLAMRRTAAFLRTCRLVYEEGRPVLYGQNKFIVSRRHDAKSFLWTRERQEMGFSPARVFVKSIGGHNIALIRQLQLRLSDGGAAYSRDQDVNERRAVNDEYLLSVLRALVKYGQLRTLDIELYTRKHVGLYDYRFVNTLTRIKVDKVEVNDLTPDYTYRPWRTAHVQQSKNELAQHCAKKMVRATPLYPPQ